MASKKKKAAAAAGGAAGAAKAAKNSPYVQELVENDDLRDEHPAGLRVRARRGRPLANVEEARQGDLRRQEAPERPQDGRGVHPRRRPRAARGADGRRQEEGRRAGPQAS